MKSLNHFFLGELASELVRRGMLYNEKDQKAFFAAARILTAMSYPSDMPSSAKLALQDAQDLLSIALKGV